MTHTHIYISSSKRICSPKKEGSNSKEGNTWILVKQAIKQEEEKGLISMMVKGSESMRVV